MTNDMENVELTATDRVHTLTLTNVKPSDAALYSIKAHNPAGQTSCSARLKVARKLFLYAKVCCEWSILYLDLDVSLTPTRSDPVNTLNIKYKNYKYVPRNYIIKRKIMYRYPLKILNYNVIILT